jgi:hypothetical protein
LPRLQYRQQHGKSNADNGQARSIVQHALELALIDIGRKAGWGVAHLGFRNWEELQKRGSNSFRSAATSWCIDRAHGLG